MSIAKFVCGEFVFADIKGQIVKAVANDGSYRYDIQVGDDVVYDVPENVLTAEELKGMNDGGLDKV